MFTCKQTEIKLHAWLQVESNLCLICAILLFFYISFCDLVFFSSFFFFFFAISLLQSVKKKSVHLVKEQLIWKLWLYFLVGSPVRKSDISACTKRFNPVVRGRELCAPHRNNRLVKCQGMGVRPSPCKFDNRCGIILSKAVWKYFVSVCSIVPCLCFFGGFFWRGFLGVFK